MSDREEDRGFQVRDRRRFTESGETRDETEGSGGAAADAPCAEPRPSAERTPPPRDHAGELPPITFSAFLMSLSSQALACMGELPDEGAGTPPVDLAAARELIDILGMLKEKTRGNLDSTEAGLLDGLLYDLRMRYVGKVRG